MADFDFVKKKIKRVFKKNSKKTLFNHGYSTGETGRSYADPETRYGYDAIAHGVRLLVIDMRQKLSGYYKDYLGYDEARARQLADQLISYRVDPIAKQAEQDKGSAIDFTKKVMAMYKEFNLPLPTSNFRYHVK